MNTTAPRHTATYSFTTCKRCGYIITAEEELCQACKDQKENTTNNTLL